ncbi:hypothetical protein AVEN_53912-1 [Araneus ventricosus]|uniref:Uncharacterized protein n=1 Tax=Araneus ventricosus TaxID=182803 RepID=A0A4Y2IFI0_ARAVE|nr:hypothetical protein AVEN_53912-1 [Araneus ventricosus]
MFPNPLDYVDLPTLRTNTPDDAPFAKKEIAIVIKNLHKGKAPGPDGIDNIIIQQINKRFPILFMELFNKCLDLGTFPDPLKLDDKLNWNAHLRNLSTKAFTLYQNLLKITGKNWEFSLKLRRMLYKTVIERMLAYGAAVWCLDPPIRIKRKLNTIERPFLLTLTGAYRTTSTSALQVILGIPPLYLQLQQEARVTAIRRLNISLPDTLTTLVPGEVEKGETGWAAHPAECPSEEQISLVDGGGITSGTRIYTGGSKTEKGVGAEFCVWSGQNIVYRWLAKLQDYNTVFQAELLALKHATDHAANLSNQPITILVDNQASV